MNMQLLELSKEAVTENKKKLYKGNDRLTSFYIFKHKQQRKML